jgi:hypothetical protein
MAKELLSIQDIKELNDLLRQVFRYITNLKSTHRLADKIKYPQIPSILSESLVIHLLKRNILPELSRYNFSFGGKKADILAKINREELKIEVKATAKNAFEYLGGKDITADYIFWVHFGEFYLNSKDKIVEIYIIKNPHTYFKNPVKITLSKLRGIIGNNLKKTEVDINSL